MHLEPTHSFHTHYDNSSHHNEPAMKRFDRLRSDREGQVQPLFEIITLQSLEHPSQHTLGILESTLILRRHGNTATGRNLDDCPCNRRAARADALDSVRRFER